MILKASGFILPARRTGGGKRNRLKRGHGGYKKKSPLKTLRNSTQHLRAEKSRLAMVALKGKRYAHQHRDKKKYMPIYTDI